MDSIAELMANDHRRCDDDFSVIEQAVKKDDWGSAERCLAEFRAALERHLTAEETVLFPAFEAATGMSMGPTRVMRMEHMQMRSLLDDLQTATAAGNAAEFRGQVETLLILMQQHNLKEENVLYPMCDQHLSGEAASLCGQLGSAVSRGA